jgi:hypothetical protein
VAECETPDELVERVLREGRVPPHRRAALRRELLGHFEDSAAIRPVERVIRAFGDAAEVTTALRALYRRESILLYCLKLVLLVAVGLGAATAILALVSLRPEAQPQCGAAAAGAWRLAPGYGTSLVVAAALVLGVIAWREATGPRFVPLRAAVAALAWGAACAWLLRFSPDGAAAVLWAVALLAGGLAVFRRSLRPPRVLLAVLVFAATITTLHAFSSVPIGLGAAVLRSTALVAAWLVTVAVAAQLDRLCLDPFQSTQGEMK